MSPARLRVLRAASAGGGAWLPIGSSLGAWPQLQTAPQLRRVKCGSHRLRVLFIEGRGVGLFTRYHWLDLNRPDCGPATGRDSRVPRLAPDSSCEAGPLWTSRRWIAGPLGMLVPSAVADPAGSTGRGFRPFLVKRLLRDEEHRFCFHKNV